MNNGPASSLVLALGPPSPRRRASSTSFNNGNHTNGDINNNSTPLPHANGGILLVTVFNLENVSNINTSNNFYCKLSTNVGDSKHLSNSRPGPTPTWDEPFSFVSSEELTTIAVAVYEKKQMKKDKKLGVVSVKVNEYYSREQIGVSQTIELPLSLKKNADNQTTETPQVKLRIGLMFIDGESPIEPSSNSNFRNQESPLPITERSNERIQRRNSLNDRQPRRLHRNVANSHSRRSSDPEFPRAAESQRNRPRALSETTQTAVVPASQQSPYPPGWQISRTDEGRIFFVNKVDRLSQWEDPRIKSPNGEGVNPRVRPIFSSVKEFGNLPLGWQERLSTEGRVYFVDHVKHVTQWIDPRVSIGNDSSNSSSSASSLRLLASPLNANAPSYTRDYLSKLQQFRSHIPTPDPTNRYVMKINQSNLFEDSFRRVSMASVQELKRRLWIEFEGEVGLDYGGLTREWFNLLSKEMFNPLYCLFEYSALDNYTLQISPNSFVNPHHLDYFYFIGRVTGMAVYHDKFLDAFFTTGFYKKLLGKPLALSDLESMDLSRYQSLKWMLENDITGIIFETFSVSLESFGRVIDFELKPGGSTIEVTEKNKKEYVDLYVKWRANYNTQEQVNKFLQGFYEFIPQTMLLIFDHTELGYLIGGIAEIDIEDWKKNTNYKLCKPTDPIIKWFWMIVGKYDNERRCRLLQFVTGTSRVPAAGFKNLWGSDGLRKFTIELWGEPTYLPRSHTCFNRLDLPPYESYELLEEKLTYAIENTSGFGID